MPTADYSSYHQPDGTTSDGTKFDNFVDAVQATVNALDKNNLAADAGVLGSQLATGINGPPGTEIDYVENTSTVTVSGTSGAQTTLITGNAVTYDGSTAVWVECFAPQCAAGSGDEIVFQLWDGAASVGIIGIISASSGVATGTVTGRKRLTPTSGSHTYTLKAWRNTNNGSIIAQAPAYLRITKA